MLEAIKELFSLTVRIASIRKGIKQHVKEYQALLSVKV